MHSEAYNQAKKEFRNCLILSPVCLFISIFIAFKEWWPIMQVELTKEKACQV